MGPYAAVYYNLTLCQCQSQLQHIYQGNPKQELTLILYQSELYPPVRDLGFGLKMA